MNRLYPEYEHHGIYDEYQTEEKSYYRIAWFGDIVAGHFEYMDKTGSYKCQYKELRILFLPDSVHVMIPLYTQYSLFSLIMPEIGEIFNNKSEVCKVFYRINYTIYFLPVFQPKFTKTAVHAKIYEQKRR